MGSGVVDGVESEEGITWLEGAYQHAHECL